MDTIKFLLISCLSFAVIFLAAEGQFPKVCVNLASLKNRECCPVPAGFKQPCGSDGSRGECKALTGPKWGFNYSHFKRKYELDDRLQFPQNVFSTVCHCRSNFAGYDCAKCKFGFYGQECKERKVLIRKNFCTLPPEEKDKYMRYITMQRNVQSDYMVATVFYDEINKTISAGSDPTRLFANVSNYGFLVWLHYAASKVTILSQNKTERLLDFAHGGQGLPTWHRLYMLAWERSLQEISGDENFALPYWDWTEGEHKCDMFSEMLLGNLTENGTVVGKYFKDWYVVCSAEQTEHGAKLCDPRKNIRGLKRFTTKQRHDIVEKEGFIMTFPTKREVNFALRFKAYDQPPYDKQSSCNFRNLLEGWIDTDTGYRSPNAYTLHNRAHIVVGGTFTDVPAASNDPLFPLHHAFVDRIFEQWLRRYKNDASVLTATDAPIGHNRRDPIVPMFPVYTNEDFFKDSFSFGYDYDVIDKDGKSPDDEESEEMGSLGQCPGSCQAIKCIIADKPSSNLGLIVATAIMGALLLLIAIIAIVLIARKSCRTYNPGQK